jgi:two-component system sensor histidine kinase DesK
VCDDGAGPRDEHRSGHGLDGLRERASAAGAVLVTSPIEPSGFRLSVLAR